MVQTEHEIVNANLNGDVPKLTNKAIEESIAQAEELRNALDKDNEQQQLE